MMTIIASSPALDLQTNDLRLKKVHVAYVETTSSYLDITTSALLLPFSFWDIKNLYIAHGVKFDYSISILTALEAALRGM